MGVTAPDKPLPTAAEALNSQRVKLVHTDDHLPSLQRNLTGPVSEASGQQVTAEDLSSPLNQVFQMGSFTPHKNEDSVIEVPGSHQQIKLTGNSNLDSYVTGDTRYVANNPKLLSDYQKQKAELIQREKERKKAA